MKRQKFQKCFWNCLSREEEEKILAIEEEKKISEQKRQDQIQRDASMAREMQFEDALGFGLLMFAFEKMLLDKKRDPIVLSSMKYATQCKESETCSICLEDFQVGQLVTVLACRHTFHFAEITKWVNEGTPTCPLCKSSVS
jgi:hypothetical protein